MLPQEVIRAKRDGQTLSAEAIAEFVAGLSALDHYNAFRQGVIGVPDLIYFAGLITVSLALAGVLIAERRGGGR